MRLKAPSGVRPFTQRSFDFGADSLCVIVFEEGAAYHSGKDHLAFPVALQIAIDTFYHCAGQIEVGVYCAGTRSFISEMADECPPITFISFLEVALLSFSVLRAGVRVALRPLLCPRGVR